MAQVDSANRSVNLKFVYYGPPGAGKTTNLHRIYERLSNRHQCRVLTLDPTPGHTRMADLLTIAITVGESRLLVRLLTVPGMVMHNHSRRILLRGVDGVAFVTDATGSPAAAAESYDNLRHNLRDCGLKPEEVPLICQLNKWDRVPDGKSAVLERLEALWHTDHLALVPLIPAVAERGEGVLETLLVLTAAVWTKLQSSSGLETHTGITSSALLSALGERVQAAELAIQTDRYMTPVVAPSAPALWRGMTLERLSSGAAVPPVMPRVART